MKQLSKITFQILAGANVASILIMLLVGHADMLNPEQFPRLSNIGLVFPGLLVINILFLVFWLLIKPRYALIPFLGFIVCYGPVRTYCPVNIPQDPPKGSIKVLSYNVLNYTGWGPVETRDEILKYIARQKADIVCLQESQPNGIGQAVIDSIVGYLYPYKASSKHKQDYMTLFSKYPILSRERIDYQSKGNMSVAYKISVNGRGVIVINNHLETTALSKEEKQKFKDLIKGELESDTATATSKWLIGHLGQQTKRRAPQADAVARYMSYHAGTPMIVCGDFNDSPISYVHRTIAKNLTDCYIATANGPGISYHYSGFYVRIDNILCSHHFTPYACQVDKSIKWSDHYPIICWLKLKPNSL